MSDERADLEVDAVGQRCPIPVIRLAQRIREVALGGVISVLSDDPAAALDVPAWCGLRGQAFLGTRPSAAGGVAYLVRRVR